MNEGRALDDNGVLVCQRLAAAFNLVTCATVLRDEGVPDTLPTIGIEVEVPFSSYFPGLWRSYGLDRRPLRDMEAHELHAFSTECAAAEVTLRRRLALTVECGVPRGADRYWEFSFAPVRSVGLLVEQVRLQSATTDNVVNYTAVVAVRSARRMRRCQSTFFIRGFTARSSAPKSDAMRAALLEQPASFSSSA